MKYLVSLLIVLSTLFVEAQTYEKIKEAVPSDVYKKHEGMMNRFFKNIKFKDNYIGSVAYKTLVERYYSMTQDIFSENLNNITPAKVNKFVGEFLTSDDFNLYFVCCLTILCSTQLDVSCDEKLTLIDTLVIRQSIENPITGKPGILAIYIAETINK